MALKRRWITPAQRTKSGFEARHALRLKPDHPIGADHGCIHVFGLFAQVDMPAGPDEVRRSGVDSHSKCNFCI